MLDPPLLMVDNHPRSLEFGTICAVNEYFPKFGCFPSSPKTKIIPESTLLLNSDQAHLEFQSTVLSIQLHNLGVLDLAFL